MDQLRCPIVGHDSAIQALCVNTNCTSPQRVVCFSCLVEFHHPCHTKLLKKPKLIETLNLQKAQIEADERINNLQAEFIEIETKIVQQLAVFKEEIDKLFLAKSKRLNIINKVVNESQFTLDSWMIAYELVIDQTDYIESEFKAINQSLNQFKMSFNLFSVSDNSEYSLTHQPCQFELVSLKSKIILNQIQKTTQEQERQLNEMALLKSKNGEPNLKTFEDEQIDYDIQMLFQG